MKKRTHKIYAISVLTLTNGYNSEGFKSSRALRKHSSLVYAASDSFFNCFQKYNDSIDICKKYILGKILKMERKLI